MKRIFTLIALFAFALGAHAQMPGGGSTITGRISGTVIDSVTKKPVDYATISIFRSGGKAPLNGTLTDEKGGFKLNNVAPGSYKIAITFIGYPTKVIDPVTTTPGKPDNNMGTVIISPSSRSLSAVTVVGQTPVVENRIDKIVYNAEKDLTSAGGNATDILRKVPLVTVDIDGNPSLRGDQNVRVLINGKPSGALSTSLADVLRTIPADQIKSIEVITAPSAKYDAEGSGGIINIITKSKNASGLSGSVSGGLGTRQNNGNANLNYKHNRLSLSANLGTNFAYPQESLVETYSQTASTIRTTDGSSKTKRFGTIGSVNGSYDFNEYNGITSSFRLNGGGMRNDGTFLNTNTVFGNTAYNSTNYNKGSFSGFDWNADYTHKFKKEGEELTLAGQWSRSAINTDYATQYFGVPAGFITQTPNQMGSNDGTNNEYTAQLDYTLPVSSKFKVEAGAKDILRKLTSNYDVFSQVNNQGAYLLDNMLSNTYDYDQNVYAGYTVLSFTLPKSYALQVGARVEHTKIDGDPSNAITQGIQPFSNSYTTFIPSFVLSKTFKSNNTLKLSYSKRIQRPSLQFLNPFINKANPYNQTQGNPELSPEISQTVELGYTAFIKSSVISFSTYYKHTSDLIEGYVTAVQDEQYGTINRTTYRNIGNNNSLGASMFGSVNPIKILTLRGSVNAYTYKPSANGIPVNQQINNGTYIQYNIFAGASVALKGGFTAEVFGILNAQRRVIQGTNPAFNLMGLGVKKDIIAKKFTLGLNALQPYQKYLHFNTKLGGGNSGFVQDQKISYPLRSFGVTFTYNFGKVTYGAQPKKKGVKNDDLLQGGDQNGAPAGSTGGTGTGNGGGR